MLTVIRPVSVLPLPLTLSVRGVRSLLRRIPVGPELEVRVGIGSGIRGGLFISRFLDV